MSLINFIRERAYRRRTPKESITLPSAARFTIVPTRFGIAFLTLLLVMFIWSVNHQLNLGYALIFILAFTTFFSAALTVGYLAKLRLDSDDAEPVFCGQEAYFPITLIDTIGQSRPEIILSNAQKTIHCEGIEAGKQSTVLLPQFTLQRGRQNILPFEISTALPFGLFIAWQWLRLKGEVIIYPEPVGELPLPLEISKDEGKMIAENLGDDELTGLQPYQPGDALSRVAWKQLGRGEMMVKRFGGEGGERVVLDYAKAIGDNETRLCQLSKWIVDCDAANLIYALRLPHQFIDFGRGKTHFHHCLTALADCP
ncbi:DUF58 domain-containing protein [Suttonella ornithocola]|uniref:Uncharacterized conserved protein (Some members contain a von Willebrand factor type A (VWA) domain) n=1 Tax=Suttonella ornithocola TaxID=279832 RepID=A0A380N0R4_9GAMM|nr:DUF58 domain-containing protein [Suttonella ornithocola]SUO97876.1 Uncharacterized conserved protein (some members contain a von Willebrand factor type A (vWA) domain) [Suttonella ornithocola]